ncbi:MAG: PEGA domain-containing protein, partial [Myxococcota bacterium]
RDRRRNEEVRPEESIRVSGTVQQETVVRAPNEERSELVPAGDGGPPLAADDPMAKRWMSTVIKPRPRDRTKPSKEDVSAGPGAWSETFERALNARVKDDDVTEKPGARGAPKPRPAIEGGRNIVLGRERIPPSIVVDAQGNESGRAPMSKTPSRYEVSTAQRRVSSSWVRIAAFCVVALALTIGLMLFVRPAIRKARPIRPAIVPAAELSVEVRSQPGGAFVEDAETGAFLGKTPLSVSVPRGGARRVRVMKSGYADRVVELSSDAPSTWVPLIKE